MCFAVSGPRLHQPQWTYFTIFIPVCEGQNNYPTELCFMRLQQSGKLPKCEAISEVMVIIVERKWETSHLVWSEQKRNTQSWFICDRISFCLNVSLLCGQL